MKLIKSSLLVKIHVAVVDLGVNVICLSSERGFVKKKIVYHRKMKLKSGKGTKELS